MPAVSLVLTSFETGAVVASGCGTTAAVVGTSAGLGVGVGVPQAVRAKSSIGRSAAVRMPWHRPGDVRDIDDVDDISDIVFLRNQRPLACGSIRTFRASNGCPE